MIIHFNRIFHYKPSSYWGTHINGNPHVSYRGWLLLKHLYPIVPTCLRRWWNPKSNASCWLWQPRRETAELQGLKLASAVGTLSFPSHCQRQSPSPDPPGSIQFPGRIQSNLFWWGTTIYLCTSYVLVSTPNHPVTHCEVNEALIQAKIERKPWVFTCFCPQHPTKYSGFWNVLMFSVLPKTTWNPSNLFKSADPRLVGLLKLSHQLLDRHLLVPAGSPNPWGWVKSLDNAGIEWLIL